MSQISLSRKEEILMRSAQSRLGLVTSLGAAHRGVSRCVAAFPVSPSAIKVGGAAVAGLAGAALMRALFSSRRKKAAAAVAASPAPSRPHVGYLLSETALALLLPLIRRYVLRDAGAACAGSDNVVDRLLREGR